MFFIYLIQGANAQPSFEGAKVRQIMCFDGKGSRLGVFLNPEGHKGFSQGLQNLRLRRFMKRNWRRNELAELSCLHLDNF